MPALDRINAMPAEELAALLRQCVAVPRWGSELAAARPFADPDALLATAAELTAGLSDAELRQALADHPRIGERAKPASGSASFSATEQSGVDRRDADLAARLAAANRAYEARFGHIYLVCATGRDGTGILADLRARLDNTPEAELGVVRTELGRIAALRLEKILDDA